ncbi:MAG: DUF881 domain-containing protein [Clostridia bacterium]|nr:DUF881 domain-containing protein [Clostridia bacterium]
MKTFKMMSLTVVCLLLGITIAWQFRSVKLNQVLAQYEKKNVSQIIDELLMEKSNNDTLKVRLQELQKEVDAFKNDENVDQQYVDQMKQSVLLTRMMAGLETVKGSGMVLVVEAGGERSVDASDIEDLVNELKASDVQAICVNDERIVAMSEIRKAGDYVMINGRQLVPPYTIKAIGDPEKIDRSLKLMGGILSRYEVRDFKVDLKKDDNIVIPGVRDDGTVLRIDKLTPVDQ